MPMPDGGIPENFLDVRTTRVLALLVEAALFALLWDVSKPLLIAITCCGAFALLASEVALGPPRLRRYVVAISASVTFILCGYAAFILSFPDAAARWQLFYSPIQIEIANISLRNPSDLRVVASDFRGTLAWMFIRAENRGDSNSAEDWQLTATTTAGDTYEAELVQVTTDIHLTNGPNPNPPQYYPYYPSDQIWKKTSNPMTKGQWVMGYSVFVFPNIPISTLNLPGTIFTLKCKDVLTQRIAEVSFKWTGKTDEWAFWPGMTNSAICYPTATATPSK